MFRNRSIPPVARPRVAWLRVVVLMVGAIRVAGAAGIEERFETDPAVRGWQVLGESSLFSWDSGSGLLAVTWDSSRTNSYYHRPLGRILSSADDFVLGFDLRLSDIAIGVDSSKPFTFELAVGLIRFEDAIRPGFFRGAGIHPGSGPRNVVEFAYFPDSGFGATFAPTVISSNNRIVFSDNHPLEMTVNDWFRIVMRHTSADRTLRTEVTRNGAAYGLSPGNTLRELNLGAHPDFEVDTVAVMSYSDGGQTPSFGGSILAHGVVDNLGVVLPDGPIETVTGRWAGGGWEVEFASRAGWGYELERTSGFEVWEGVDEGEGDGAVLVLRDDAPLAGGGFYRVSATLMQ